MLELTEKYRIIREYKGDFDIEELLKRIVRIHVKSNAVMEVNNGCSDHKVKYDK